MNIGITVSDHQFSHACDLLREFVAIPSCSHPTSPYYNMETMNEAAKFASNQLTELGFSPELISIDESAPFVVAEKIINVAYPTLLLYGHYDVQPVEEDKWNTKPFELNEINGRLYGRGASDDKGGIIAILTALRAYKEAGKELPVNIRILFEGEEEYGSSHLGKLLEQHADRLNAKALVIMDGLNKDVATGTIATSTRGLINISLKITALEKPVHSGIGCLLPDPAKAMVQLLGSLVDETKIPNLTDGCDTLGEEERRMLRQDSISSEQYAKDHKLVDGATLRGNPEESIDERTVMTPSVSIVNMNAGQPKGGNSIQATAEAQVGIRLLPGQNPKHIAESVMNFIRSQKVLYNLPLEMQWDEPGAWAWKTDLTGTYTKKYMDALKEHFPKASPMPCGGALPLIRDFQQVFPQLEVIVPGVEDPDTSAHSHNESQDISVFRNSINSLISFLDKAGQAT